MEEREERASLSPRGELRKTGGRVCKTKSERLGPCGPRVAQVPPEIFRTGSGPARPAGPPGFRRGGAPLENFRVIRFQAWPAKALGAREAGPARVGTLPPSPAPRIPDVPDAAGIAPARGKPSAANEL